MVFLRNFTEQLKQLWLQASQPARALFVAASVLCACLIVGVGIWSSRPQYVALATNLGPAEAAEMVSKLNAQGIDNKMNFAGSTVLVPKNLWNQARLVAGDTLGPLPPPSEGLDESLLGDPSLNHYKILRRREETLARTIARMDSVATATVHIARPEPTPFVQDQKPTTASVVLELRSGSNFSKEQAAAVVAMVAGSVDDLEPNAVTVTDTRGRILSTTASQLDADISHQFEYRRTIEADLASKAETMLAEMLGSGRAVVRVTADIDFTRTERTETIYDPETKVKKSEMTKTTSRTNPAAPSFVPSGTSSNLGGYGQAGQTAPVTEKEELLDTEYENAVSVDKVKIFGGTIARLTVAAMVDLSEDSSAEQGAAVSGVSKEQVEAIIKQAVGFNPQRDDQIEVLVTELTGDQVMDRVELLEGQKWQHYSELARNCSLGVAAIVALLLGFMVLKSMKPLAPQGDASGTASADRSRFLSEFSSQAERNPAAVSHIIAAWLDKSISSAESPGAEQEPSRGSEVEPPTRAAA